MSFVHLHVHSHFSLLDGLSKVPDLVKKAKELGFESLALTDHGALYGAIEFYKECRKNGLKPIIGMEAYVAPRQLFLKQPHVDDKNRHLTLLAQNEQGYKNLMLLATIGQIDGFYYRPRLDRQTLKKYAAGLICLSGCAKGELREALRSGQHDQVTQIINDYREIFGENYYIELQNLVTSDAKFAKLQKEELAQLKLLSSRQGIKAVATADVHYLEPADADIQDILVCVQTGKTVSDNKRLDMRSTDLSLYPSEKMQALFADYPQALENAETIARLCELTLDLKSWHYPAFKTPAGKTDESYLRELVVNGAKQRYSKITPEIQKRIDYELDIINYKKYASYFLIYADFMNWAREHGILTTARGSVSGSVVSYSLFITNVDPLLFKVPFERFLTKERPSPPDIDADMMDSRRDEIIDYVKRQYGADKVAQICTFGTMMARGSFRDVARALGQTPAWADQYAKMIPFGSQGFPMTLKRALKETTDLRAVYDSNPEVRQVYDMAGRIEGCVRHVSVHAAGVVVTPGKLTDFIPLQIEPKGRNIITQYDMYALDPNSSKESVGVLKMDFLGLRNLSILGRCVDLVKAVKGKNISVDSIPLDDKKTFQMLSQGLTFGVFQLSSTGMTRYLKELKPTQVSDLMAMVALYRPGPIENIPEFIRRKNNPKLIAYPDERLREVLEMSYGLLVYQDDVLYTVIILAGYEPSAADAFRKAVGKKIPAEMEAQKTKFYAGCEKNGLSRTKIDDIWKLIEPFAAYGFNKAHSASYGMLAYQTAYMKANFPAEYMTAIMTCESANPDKVAEAAKECVRLGIALLPPDVNESRDDFTYISDKAIRFGLSAIKNLGTDIVLSIINERKSNGQYQSLQDFLSRVKSKNLNKKSLEALIKAGALDSLGERGKMWHNADKLLQFIRYSQKDVDGVQASLFGAVATVKPVLQLAESPLLDQAEKLAWEKELLGIYVSDHPFKRYLPQLDGVLSLNAVKHVKDPRDRLLTAGLVTKVKQITTKKGDAMAFVQLEDMTDQLEALVFPELFSRSRQLWLEGNTLIVMGKISERDNEHKIILDQAAVLSENDQDTLNQFKTFLQNKPTRKAGLNRQPSPVLPSTTPSEKNKDVVVFFRQNIESENLQALKNIFLKYPGTQTVHLLVGANGNSRRVITKYKINLTDEAKQSIESITGANSVRSA